MEWTFMVAVDVDRRDHQVAATDSRGCVLDTSQIEHDPASSVVSFERMIGRRSVPDQPIGARRTGRSERQRDPVRNPALGPGTAGGSARISTVPESCRSRVACPGRDWRVGL